MSMINAKEGLIQKMNTNNEVTISFNEPLTGYDKTEELKNKLNTFINESNIKIINLDLSDSASIDSAAISQILIYKNKFSRQGVLLRIKGCSTQIAHILKIIKVDQSISVIP